MSPVHLIELVFLAALWGASFLFMRVTAPEFGPVALITVRVFLAALFLCSILSIKSQWSALKGKWWPALFVGVINSALPFTLIAYSTLHVTAGFASVLNAMTPLFALVIGFFWFRDPFSPMRLLGMVIGFTGVVVLVYDKLDFGGSEALAILAGILAAALYGLAANYSRLRLQGVNPLALAAASQMGATISLAPLCLFWWPAQMPSGIAWVNAVVLAVFCTGLAYIIYFRLLENIGAERATTVTFLIPVFGIFWGALILSEEVTLQIILATGIILMGTLLATNLIKLRLKLKA